MTEVRVPETLEESQRAIRRLVAIMRTLADVSDAQLTELEMLRAQVEAVRAVAAPQEGASSLERLKSAVAAVSRTMVIRQ
jgi:hypothetical protein